MPTPPRLELLERLVDAARILKRCNVRAHSSRDPEGRTAVAVELTGATITEWQALWALLEQASEPTLLERPLTIRKIKRERL